MSRRQWRRLQQGECKPTRRRHEQLQGADAGGSAWPTRASRRCQGCASTAGCPTRPPPCTIHPHTNSTRLAGAHLVGHQLLGGEGGDGDHGQAAVVQLLGLQVLVGSGVGGLQAQGVEAVGGGSQGGGEGGQGVAAVSASTEDRRVDDSRLEPMCILGMQQLHSAVTACKQTPTACVLQPCGVAKGCHCAACWLQAADQWH